jgi:hypothetical protein
VKVHLPWVKCGESVEFVGVLLRSLLPNNTDAFNQAPKYSWKLATQSIKLSVESS